VHGGMGDAFRGRLDYEWMVGGHFVGHPHVGDYTVRITNPLHVITEGLPASYAYKSEQYYMMMDPVVDVLADTVYVHEGRSLTMPVVWTKKWGAGRVFYNALGHHPDEFTTCAEARRLTVRGCLWAAGLL
jgi:type 1 glutamine amidotransferase